MQWDQHQTVTVTVLLSRLHLHLTPLRQVPTTRSGCNNTLEYNIYYTHLLGKQLVYKIIRIKSCLVSIAASPNQVLLASFLRF